MIYSNLPEWSTVAPAQRTPASEPEEVISKRAKKAKKKQARKGDALATLTKPAAKVRDYDAHVLVCKGADCKERGSKAVRRAL